MNTTFELAGKQIEIMNAQTQAINQLYADFKNEVTDIRSEMADFKEDIDYMKKHQFLLPGELSKIQELKRQKSIELANDYFNNRVSSELFTAKRIHLGQAVLYKIKKFNNLVGVGYQYLPHSNFDATVAYLQELTLADIPKNYFKLTDKMQEIANKNNDKPHHVYFGQDWDSENLFEEAAQ